MMLCPNGHSVWLEICGEYRCWLCHEWFAPDQLKPLIPHRPVPAPSPNKPDEREIVASEEKSDAS
jgi:hypothetical protein